MSMVDDGYMNHSDFGIFVNSVAGRELTEELGMPPPWPLLAIKVLFDSKHVGWDVPAQLPPSSPVSRLRGLAEALARRADVEDMNEVLRGLGSEVKHAQVRVMCAKSDGNSCQEECCFLLRALEDLGALLLAEREARWHHRITAALQPAEMSEVKRRAGQDAASAAREEVKHQRMDDVFMNHSDFGLFENSDASRKLSEELGMPPPWPLMAIEILFDSKYPGWDEPPQLPLSSPVSRLCGPVEAMALSGLVSEAKHAQVRFMCATSEGKNLLEECCFLLCAPWSLVGGGARGAEA